MSSGNDYDGRMDFLEILITTLKDHEKKLSEVADGFEKNVSDLKNSLKNVQSSPSEAAAATIQCSDWKEFRREVKAAPIATFSFRDNLFTVSAFSNEQIYAYSEPLPVREFRVKREGARYVLDGLIVDSLDAAPLTFGQALCCGLGGVFVTSTHLLNDGTCVFRATLCVEPSQTRDWLCKELDISGSKILQGKISH